MTILWDRLERLLHREKHAARREHRDLMDLPLEERIERGDSLGDLRFVAEEPGGRIVLACRDNQAKYREGEMLRLANGDDGAPRARLAADGAGRAGGARGEVDARGAGRAGVGGVARGAGGARGDGGARGVAGVAVTYASFDEAARRIVVVRDPYRREGRFDPALPLQLDPQDGSLVDLALEALGELRRSRTREAEAARAVLEHRAGVRAVPGLLDAAVRMASGEDLALDASKREAFVAALAHEPVTLVQGPPGSGKTFLLAHVVAAMARRGERILVTAHTHRAVNNALAMIAKVAPELRVVKAGRSSGSDDIARTRVETVPSLRRLPAGDDRPMVVGTTVFGSRAGWSSTPWDRVVFDEAAQVPLAYAPAALLLARAYLLVGDHRQLGPIVQGRHDDPLAGASLFEHLASTYPPVLLRTTYRMNAGIAALPSRVFYDGRLTPSSEASARRFPAVAGGPFDEIFDPERPAVLATVDHEGFRTRCEIEARAVAALSVDLLARQGLSSADLAVVSPYRAQLRLIRTLMRRGLAQAGRGSSPLPVIDTVERIQGQEREAVIVSMCASDPDWLSSEQAEFFLSPNRLNVTLTRARTKLVIVASPRAFRAFPPRFDQLARADLFRRLYRGLPRVDLSDRFALRTVLL